MDVISERGRYVAFAGLRKCDLGMRVLYYRVFELASCLEVGITDSATEATVK